MLGDRHRDAADVGLLEGVGADRGGADLAGDGHHRDRVHVGVGERGDQVGRAGTAGGHADADLAGGHGVPLGRVARALLVADQDVPDLRVEEGVVRRKDRAARDAEDVLRAGVLERLDQALRTGDRLGTCGSLLGHLLIFSVAVRPTKNPSCRSADEGSTRGVRAWGLSSRVACVRESQNAWAHHAPAPFRAQLSVPPVPDRGISIPHPGSGHRSVTGVSPGGPPSQVQMHAWLPSASATTQNAGARSSLTRVPPASSTAWIRACGHVVRDADVEVAALPVRRLGVGLLEPQRGLRPAPSRRSSSCSGCVVAEERLPEGARPSRGPACPARSRARPGRRPAALTPASAASSLIFRARRTSRCGDRVDVVALQGDRQVRVAQVHVGVVVGLVGGLGDLGDQRGPGVEVTGLEPGDQLVEHPAPVVEALSQDLRSRDPALSSALSSVASVSVIVHSSSVSGVRWCPSSSKFAGSSHRSNRALRRRPLVVGDGEPGGVPVAALDDHGAAGRPPRR